MQMVGGRGGARTRGPLLAKQRPIYYVIGPSRFVLRPVPRFSLVFGRFWTQVGLKFKRGDNFLQAGTNLLDEWIGDLPLIEEVVASQLAKITCATGRQYIENRFQRQSASPGP